MRNKMILFFCMLLVSLSVPFPTYAEADVTSDVDEEMTFTCKIKSFYSDSFIPQAGDTFYIEYTNAENTNFSMLLDASECVNDWKEVEMTSGTYSITKITYVGDNTDIIIMTEGLKLVRKKLVNVIDELSKFADKYKAQPTLAFTHFQPAQPTTVGKRATLWLNELVMDLEDLDYVLSTMKLLGCKGTTGTQASFLELFNGDQDKIRQIDGKIAEKMGFDACVPVSGQTYSRKVDTRVLNVLAGIAASAHKFSNDIRLLQHLKEVEEPFEKSQIGSSAMAYKRNPMRSERMASLADFVISDALNPAIVSSTQWFERTLDDSANKRLSIPEGFLAIDGILDLCLNVVDGLVVYDKVITKHMMAELPFMATENIMMDAVKNGGNRQELHEKIRQLSMEAGKNVKVEGKDNNLLELIAADPSFNLTLEELQATMEPSKYVGRAPIQVDKFLANVVNPILEANKEDLGMTAEINV